MITPDDPDLSNHNHNQHQHQHTSTYGNSTSSTENGDVTPGVITANMNTMNDQRLKSSSFIQVIQNYAINLFGLNTLDQYKTHHQIIYPDHNHPSRKYLQATSTLYSDADLTIDSRSSRNIFSETFKKSLFEIWLKLPQSDDHMVDLDAFTVIALFENIGVILSYKIALHCLHHIKGNINSINRYHFDDVLKWYQLYGVDMIDDDDDDDDYDSSSSNNNNCSSSNSNSKKKGNDWISYKRYLISIYALINGIYQQAIDYLHYQYSVLEKIDMLGNYHHHNKQQEHHILKYTNYMKPKSIKNTEGGNTVQLQDLNYMTKLLDFQNQSHMKLSIIQCSFYFNHPEITFVNSLNNSVITVNKSIVTKKNERKMTPNRKVNNSRSSSRNSSRKPNNNSNNNKNNKNDDEDDDDDDDDNVDQLDSNYDVSNSSYENNDGRINGDDNNRVKTPGMANKAYREENDPYVYEHEGEIEQLCAHS